MEKVTTIVIAVSRDNGTEYARLVNIAKNVLNEYFGTRLVVRDSFESQWPLITIREEITRSDVDQLKELFPEEGTTQILILCHDQNDDSADVLQVIAKTDVK